MKTSFQTILLGGFIAAFVFAVLVFSNVIKLGSSSTNQAIAGTVTIWGIYPQAIVQGYLDSATAKNTEITVIYRQKNVETFRNELVEALADGQAPDLVISDSEHIFSFRDKLYTIPFATYNERLYRDSFIDGASIFLNKEGVLAIPLTVDPMVLYYNKNLLAGQSYVVPPTTWTGLVQSLPRFVKKDARGILTQTAIGLGEADNVNHYKDILSTLFLQTGNPVVSLNTTTDTYEQKITTNTTTEEELGTAKALDFYTGFANQASSTFSWTRTLPSTLDTFLSGKSAFYIGRASELFTIQARNPNLSFDVTTVFQPEGAIRPITYGVFSGVSIVKNTPNFTAAYSILGTMSSKEFAQYLSSSVSVPGARRDLLLEQQTNPYVQSYFKAALSAFAWPDVNSAGSEIIFRDMIRAVNSGRSNSTQAIREGAANFQSSIR